MSEEWTKPDKVGNRSQVSTGAVAQVFTFRGHGMSETMVERVARALAASDEAEPLFGCACLGKESPQDFACPCKMRNARRRAKAAIEAMDHPVFAAMRQIQDAVGKYTDPGYPMTAEEFINVVLSAADDQEVVGAMRVETERPQSQGRSSTPPQARDTSPSE